MGIQWKGVIPALTTKFTADDKLDLKLFERNLRAQLEAGVEGVTGPISLGVRDEVRELAAGDSTTFELEQRVPA